MYLYVIYLISVSSSFDFDIISLCFCSFCLIDYRLCLFFFLFLLVCFIFVFILISLFSFAQIAMGLDSNSPQDGVSAHAPTSARRAHTSLLTLSLQSATLPPQLQPGSSLVLENQIQRPCIHQPHAFISHGPVQDNWSFRGR